MPTNESTKSIKEVSTKSPKKATKKKAATTKPRVKPISINSVLSKQKDINKLSTYVLNEENNEVIKYYQIFDQKKINNIMIELQEKLQYVHDNEIDYFDDDEQLYTHISYLIIKHMTHFYDELKNSSFEDDIAALNALVSTGLFNKIMNDVLDGNEVMRVLDLLYDVLNTSALIQNYEDEMKTEVLGKIESPVVKEKLLKGKVNTDLLN